MAFKYIVLAACIAFCSAGILPAQQIQYSSAADVSHVYNSYNVPTLGSYSDGHLAHGVQQQNILRTHGGTISQISKQVVSPHSSVSKFDTRINNDGLKTVSYASPSVVAYKSAPVYAQSQIAASPLAYSQPAVVSSGHGLGHVTYSSPIVNYGW